MEKQTLGTVNMIFSGNDRSPKAENKALHIETLMADAKTNREKAAAKQIIKKMHIISPQSNPLNHDFTIFNNTKQTSGIGIRSPPPRLNLGGSSHDG